MKQRIKLGKLDFLDSMQHNLTKEIEFETQGFMSLPEIKIKVSSRHKLDQEQLHFNSLNPPTHSLNPHDFGVYTKLVM